MLASFASVLKDLQCVGQCHADRVLGLSMGVTWLLLKNSFPSLRSLESLDLPLRRNEGSSFVLKLLVVTCATALDRVEPRRELSISRLPSTFT